MHGPKISVGAFALVLLAAALPGCGGSADADGHAAASGSVRAAPTRWVDVAPPPAAGADGVAAGTAGGSLVVAVRGKADREGVQTVTPYVRAGDAWTRAESDAPIVTAAGAPLDVVDDGAGHACLQTVQRPIGGGAGARFVVFCLADGRWRALPAVPGGADRATSLGQLFASGGRLQVAAVRQTGNAKQGAARSTARVLAYDGGAWRDAGGSLGGGAGASATPTSTARVRGLGGGSGACVVADRIERGSARLPRGGIGVRCANDGRWRSASPDFPLTGTSVAQLSDATRLGETTFAGTVQLPLPSAGRDAFAFDWRIHRLTGARWRTTPLPALPGGWSSQGHLATLAGGVYATRLALRPLAGRSVGYAARLDVLRFDARTGRFLPVGVPLLTGQEIYGPIQYGLAAVGRTIYLAWQRPDATNHTNSIVVSRLDG